MFNPADLVPLEDLLTSATVVAMEDIHDRGPSLDAIGLRHDVDHDLATAHRIALWEYERGIRSTYFILHTAHEYWDQPGFAGRLDSIAALGHEIGLHVNALAEATRTGKDPISIFEDALERLRELGHLVRGVVAHGDPACYRHGADGRELSFVNDEMFFGSERPTLGTPDREIAPGVQIRRVHLGDYGLAYESNQLPRSAYLSDSGGRWHGEMRLPDEGQLHVLWHPCWWRAVFP